VRNTVNLPIIASSGAGTAAHFTDLFRAVDVEAALAAGIFHRNEVPITDVKNSLKMAQVRIRTT
jgi:glutamine amidotransferase/cyclase